MFWQKPKENAPNVTSQTSTAAQVQIQSGTYVLQSNPNITWTTNTTAVPGTGAAYGSGSLSGSGSGYIYNPQSDNYGDINLNGRLLVKGVDIGEQIQKIQERLCILVPDLELLEKYEALREAYEHYKTLEALCRPETLDNDK